MTSTMTSSASSAPPALSEEVDPSLGRELPQTAFVGEPQETCRHGDLAVVGTDMTVDALAAEQAVRDLLIALGRDPEDEHLVDTPRRVAASFIELLTPERFELTTFPNEEGYDELVLVRDIPFRSLCQHHLLPFHGLAHVGYIPGDRILGLSKLARIVKLVRQRSAGTGAPDQTDRRLAPGAFATQGSRGRSGVRSSVYVAARRCVHRQPDGHVGRARVAPGKCPAPGRSFRAHPYGPVASDA